MHTRIVRNVVVTSALLAALPASAHAAGAPCREWQQRTLYSGLGVTENLEFTGDGRIVLSLYQRGQIGVAARGRPVRRLIDVTYPGGLRVRKRTLYFAVNNSTASGLFDLRDGRVERLNLDSMRRSAWASGLAMPNGLVFLPGGDALTSRDLGSGTGITRVRARTPAKPQYNWAAIDDSNGMAVDPTGTWLYTVSTFVSSSPVYRIKIGNPHRIQIIARLGRDRSRSLDDLDIDRAGRLYITNNALDGEVIRLNPGTGATCVIARGLGFPSAVKFGCGRGWSTSRLYVTGFDGTVRELAPPSRTRGRVRGECRQLAK